MTTGVVSQIQDTGGGLSSTAVSSSISTCLSSATSLTTSLSTAISSIAYAHTNSTPGNPTAPGSTSAYTMAGLAGTITPTATGKVHIIVTGVIIQSGSPVAVDGINLQLSYGTGTAPINGAALTGTQVGPICVFTDATTPTSAGDVAVPFTLSWTVTGLALGTAVWIDIAQESVQHISVTGIIKVGITAVELP